MYGRLTGADALPWHLGLRTAVTDARAHDLIDVAAQRISPGATLVRVCGEVDLLTAPILRSELHHQLDWPPSVLVIDLTQVRFLGVSGIEVLIEVRERAAGPLPSCGSYTTRGPWPGRCRSCTSVDCSRLT